MSTYHKPGIFLCRGVGTAQILSWNAFCCKPLFTPATAEINVWRLCFSHTALSQSRQLVQGCCSNSTIAGSWREELRPWQRSWGRRLGIRKGRIEPQESPWKFSSIYPQNQSLPTFCFVLSPTPLTLRGAVLHYLSLKKVNLQLQLIIPGCDSVSTYKQDPLEVL